MHIRVFTFDDGMVVLAVENEGIWRSRNLRLVHFLGPRLSGNIIKDRGLSIRACGGLEKDRIAILTHRDRCLNRTSGNVRSRSQLTVVHSLEAVYNDFHTLLTDDSLEVEW